MKLAFQPKAGGYMLFFREMRPDKAGQPIA